jgi:IS5 family transposase
MMGIELRAPDHTTLSRRCQFLDVTLRRVPTGEGLHLIVDSTGLSIVGEGEWARAKHGVRGTRGWKKLHLAVDRSGMIVAATLTEGHVDDATTALHLIDAFDGDISLPQQSFAAVARDSSVAPAPPILHPIQPMYLERPAV